MKYTIRIFKPFCQPLILAITFLTALLVALPIFLSAQKTDSSRYITMPASLNYKAGNTYQKLWGKHYRLEWETPVTFQKVNLDTLAGGLTPYQTGGGRQSKSVRLRDRQEREYVLRGIDKSFGKALPAIAQNTFIEKIVDDQVTIAHPYSALIIAPLAEAAGIYHTNPAIYYVPRQKALGVFNDSTGDILYLFEQRPDENWETAANFGHAEKIISTEKMLENILEDNDRTVDQRAFVRARLFDMLIGDWGRHEDQWRWASFKDDGKTLYKPIPRDRDQAFTIFDGTLVKMLIPLSGAKHMQTFDHRIKDVERFNFPARNMDHHLLNEVPLEDWISIAQDLEKRLTDVQIEEAVKRLPPEVYPLSGPAIAAKLKSRRNLLPDYARQYFLFLSREVEITGSEKTELFDIRRLANNTTEVAIYKITKEGKVKEKPIYHRVFNNKETSEIRLYGIKGNDQYHLTGNVTDGPQIKLIGGPDRDNYTDETTVRKGRSNTLIYDNNNNDFKRSGETSLRLSERPSVHEYVYKSFEYDKGGVRPLFFYSNEDRIYLGLAYTATRQQWRKEPYGRKHYIDARYSLGQKAFSSTFKTTFIEALGPWNLNLYGNLDAIRWTNFYGIGNKSELDTKDRDYHRVRSREFIGSVGLERVMNNRHKLSFNPFYQSYDILNDRERYLARQTALDVVPGIYNTKNFAGADLQYVYQKLNDSVLPVKGISFLISANYTRNIKDNPNDFQRYASELHLFLPITKNLGIATKAGAATVSGEPEFYQYATIGGSRTLRGYQRDRFYGNNTFYNQNELRWISNVRSYLFNGKLGFFGLYDIGRVWLKDENSDAWHSAYGAGLLISPFNKITISLAYGISPEDTNFHFNIINTF